MEIKNLKTGNLIRFGGEHFKRLVKLQETTGVKYFTKKDLAGCVSANKKTITKTQQKVKKLGTNAKRKQKGGVLINDDTVRRHPTEECPVCIERWDDETKNLIPFQIDECGHEICTTCATQWFVQQNKNACPLCRVRVNVATLNEQIGIKSSDRDRVFIAISENNLDKVKTYFEEGGDIHEIEDTSSADTRCNPLHYAVLHTRLEIVKYLVEKGADVNKMHSRNGYAPLHFAAKSSRSNNVAKWIVKYLVENGARVNIKAGLQLNGPTPLDFASSINSLDIVKYLVEIGKAGVTDRSLRHACHWDDLRLLKYLVNKGGNVKSKTDDGETLLHYACEWSSLEIVKYLVKKGADVNSKNNENQTPLDFSRGKRYKRPDIIEFLSKI